MDKIDLNDFIVEISQDISEIQSSLKIMKSSAYNENSDIEMADIENILEIIIAKLSNTKISLDKYIEIVFK